MKHYNHKFISEQALTLFLEDNQITDNKRLLLQVFTNKTTKDSIYKLIKIILNLLPNIKLIGTTTSGEINDEGASEHTTTLSFTQFEKTDIEISLKKNENDSYKTGQELFNILDDPKDKGLKAAICFSDGLYTNAEELLKGISSINDRLIIAGGMAGDYSSFRSTFVFTKDGPISKGAVIAFLKNPDLEVYTDYCFDWVSVGKKHQVESSYKNRVYKIEGRSAVDFYKFYLGEKIEKLLPAIGIEFPLIIQKENIDIGRAVIAKHNDGSLSFAGNIDEGSIVRFGHGDINHILQRSFETFNRFKNKNIEAVFIYSCMARKALLGENINIEIKPFHSISPICGFFTNGEFYKSTTTNDSVKFLNETMTMMALSESSDSADSDMGVQINELNEDEKLSIYRVEALSHLISVTTDELEGLTENLQKKIDEEIRKNDEKDKLLTIMQAQSQVGSMMEMIAHQWRQPLNGISSAASGIKINNEYGISTYENIDELTTIILELVDHANETINDFRELFKEDQNFEKLKAKDLIKKAKYILQPLFNRYDIKIKEDYECEGEGYLTIPIGQMVQVLIIIMKNAVDVLIEREIKEPVINIEVKKVQDYSLISIKDNAGGVSEDIIDKIFKKRFSTKLASHGTGLGLDICKTVIEKNIKGTISVSNCDCGAQFEIKLPLGLIKD